MNNGNIKHHFDMLDEMEEKENLQSKPTLINYPRIRTFKLRINGRVSQFLRSAWLRSCYGLFAICFRPHLFSSLLPSILSFRWLLSKWSYIW